MCLIYSIFFFSLCFTGYDVYGGFGLCGALLIGLLLFDPYMRIGRSYIFETDHHPWQWFRARMGWGHSVAELHHRLGLKDGELQNFQAKYSETTIPKKNGGRRRLLVPDEKTKALQRLLLRRLLRKLHVHPAAHGFVPGRSAALNAAQHAGQAVVITMDVVDFFPTTKAERIEAYFRRIGWNAQSAALLTRLTTYQNGLPQGAPTSPALSNLVNYYLDVQIAKAVERKKGTYTRYADDIAISYPLDYPRTILQIMERVKRILKSKGYRIHGLKKRRIRRQHQKQVVTGLVVNVKPQLSRTQRRWLRAVKHHIDSGKAATLTPQKLAGWQSYQSSITKVNATQKLRTYRLEANRKIIKRRKKIQIREYKQLPP